MIAGSEALFRGLLVRKKPVHHVKPLLLRASPWWGDRLKKGQRSRWGSSSHSWWEQEKMWNYKPRTIGRIGFIQGAPCDTVFKHGLCISQQIFLHQTLQDRSVVVGWVRIAPRSNIDTIWPCHLCFIFLAAFQLTRVVETIEGFQAHEWRQHAGSWYPPLVRISQEASFQADGGRALEMLPTLKEACTMLLTFLAVIS